jgi:hypothetical protein
VDKLLEEATAIHVDCPVTLPEIARIRTRRHKLLLLLHEVDMAEATEDEEASRDAAASMSQRTELRFASSVVDRITMRGIAKLRP